MNATCTAVLHVTDTETGVVTCRRGHAHHGLHHGGADIDSRTVLDLVWEIL